MNARGYLVLLIAVLLTSPPAQAKGVIWKIVVSGADLSQPVVITDHAVVEKFTIWAGPSAGWMRDGEVQRDYSRTFIDFPRGLAHERPAGLIEMNVVFHLADNFAGGYWDETYDVEYAMKPGEQGGFFYLPALPAPHPNTQLIYHGVEGNWLHSTDTWEARVRPFIEEALTSPD